MHVPLLSPRNLIGCAIDSAPSSVRVGLFLGCNGSLMALHVGFTFSSNLLSLNGIYRQHWCDLFLMGSSFSVRDTRGWLLIANGSTSSVFLSLSLRDHHDPFVAEYGVLGSTESNLGRPASGETAQVMGERGRVAACGGQLDEGDAPVGAGV